MKDDIKDDMESYIKNDTKGVIRNDAQNDAQNDAKDGVKSYMKDNTESKPESVMKSGIKVVKDIVKDDTEAKMEDIIKGESVTEGDMKDGMKDYMQDFTPQEIVTELDKYIVGQSAAKRAVAVALRNRWRMKQLPENMRDEIIPKNILMIGTTGVGKTEIARRLAKLVSAPFIKVEATKFTEIGYVGRDVEQIIRDLMDVAVNLVKQSMRSEVTAQAKAYARDKVLAALVGDSPSDETKTKFATKLDAGVLHDSIIEIQVEDTTSQLPMFDIPGMPSAQVGMFNIGEMIGKSLGSRAKTRKLSVHQAINVLIEQEINKLLDKETVIEKAINAVEKSGVVFIDEIDKIARKSDGKMDVSREGVQRDLLPILEGTVVPTKYGSVKTDHILFIAAGAFSLQKPADLIPELQGRLPIRVDLHALEKSELVKILNEPKYSLLKQYVAMLKTEGVVLDFTPNGVEAIAELAEEINSNVENIGARRLHTLLEKLLEDISFNAPEATVKNYVIDANYVYAQLKDIVRNSDLSRSIL